MPSRGRGLCRAGENIHELHGWGGEYSVIIETIIYYTHQHFSYKYIHSDYYLAILSWLLKNMSVVKVHRRKFKKYHAEHANHERYRKSAIIHVQNLLNEQIKDDL